MKLMLKEYKKDFFDMNRKANISLVFDNIKNV